MLATETNHSNTKVLETNAEKYANYVYKITLNMIVPEYDKPLDITQFCTNVVIPMNFDKTLMIFEDIFKFLVILGRSGIFM